MVCFCLSSFLPAPLEHPTSLRGHFSSLQFCSIICSTAASPFPNQSRSSSLHTWEASTSDSSQLWICPSDFHPHDSRSLCFQCYMKNLTVPARFPEPESWLPGTKELHCPLDQSAKIGCVVCGGISHSSAPAAGDSPAGEGMTWNRIDGTASTFRISVSPRI